MARSNGRAYIFVRWSGSPLQPLRLGEVAWAIEYNDRLGRFNCFIYGAAQVPSRKATEHEPNLWFERCQTVPELTKAMSGHGPDQPGYDEVKVFTLADADSEIALQFITQRAALSREAAARLDSISETREVLARYGVRGLPNAKGFNAPFLWYNMLAGRSVPVRKLPVHLFQLRMELEEKAALSPVELEDQVRQLSLADVLVLGIVECFVGRIAARVVIGLTVSVDSRMTVSEVHQLTIRLEGEIRKITALIHRVFIQVQPSELAGQSL